VIQSGGDAGLPGESGPERLVLGELGTEDLQGHLASQAEVLGQVDHGHATPADHRQDPVAGKLRA